MAIQPQANRWDRDLNAIRSVALGQLPAEGLQVHLVVVGGIGGFDHNRIEIPVQGQQGIQVSLETRQGVGVKSPPCWRASPRSCKRVSGPRMSWAMPSRRL